MKAQSIFFQTLLYVLSGAVFLLCSCTSDDPDSVPSASSGSGEVSFELVTEGGSGSGSSFSPFEVAMGETFELSISQQSRYTDTDGTVFECEPAATIALSTKVDTVYAEDLQQLTAVLEPKVKSSSDGGNPTHYSVTQEFPIGGQSVVFDLSYEVYEYTTVSGKSVEMPYVKPDQAELGSSSASESRGGAVVKSITVKPFVQSRASVSDTTWYEVNAVFNLDVECMNSQLENTRNLTFSVTYRGAVTKEIELGEPKAELSSTVDVLGGTNSVSSPYIVNPKEQMSLLFRQNSSYIDAYGNKMSCEPEAKIKLFAQTDTIYAKEKEELEGTPVSQDFVFTASGEDPVLYSAVQLFELGSQNIQLEMSYEAYTAKDIENNEIEMPYLKQNATMPSAATVKELSTVTSSKADTTFYDVRVPIKLETINVGTEDENIQTIELVVSYIGAVVTLKEVPELVRVEYRTGYVWEEAHHNLPLLYYAKVYRDRYYSNGEVFTDEFVDNGHMVGMGTFMSPDGGSYSLEDGADINLQFSHNNVNDSINIYFYNIQVTSLDAISANPGSDIIYSEAGKWDEYLVSKLYEENSFILATDIPSNNQWETTERQTGWYFKDIRGYRRYNFNYQGPTIMWDGCVVYQIDLVVYDQFLAIDGRLIDFLKYRPEYHYNFSEQETESGLEHKFECRFEFMGRNFYAAVIANISELGK